MEMIIELCGWVGAILVLGAYFLISADKVKSDSISFQLLNVFGALTLIVYTYSREAYASVLVNSIWVLIGLKALTPILLKKAKKSAIIVKDATLEVAETVTEVAVDVVSEVIPDALQGKIEETIEETIEVVSTPIEASIKVKID
tara:strand:- start:5634 stop:6065 length:432 start_codon:yes stop_codon:yes gene_type:complete